MKKKSSISIVLAVVSAIGGALFIIPITFFLIIILHVYKFAQAIALKPSKKKQEPFTENIKVNRVMVIKESPGITVQEKPIAVSKF